MMFPRIFYGSPTVIVVRGLCLVMWGIRQKGAAIISEQRWTEYKYRIWGIWSAGQMDGALPPQPLVLESTISR